MMKVVSKRPNWEGTGSELGECLVEPPDKPRWVSILRHGFPDYHLGGRFTTTIGNLLKLSKLSTEWAMESERISQRPSTKSCIRATYLVKRGGRATSPSSRTRRAD